MVLFLGSWGSSGIFTGSPRVTRSRPVIQHIIDEPARRCQIVGIRALFPVDSSRGRKDKHAARPCLLSKIANRQSSPESQDGQAAAWCVISFQWHPPDSRPCLWCLVTAYRFAIQKIISSTGAPGRSPERSRAIVERERSTILPAINLKQPSCLGTLLSPFQRGDCRRLIGFQPGTCREFHGAAPLPVRSGGDLPGKPLARSRLLHVEKRIGIRPLRRPGRNRRGSDIIF